VVTVLVVVPMGAFAVASTQQQTQPPSTEAMHHHYFEVGKSQCEATLKNAEAQQGQGQLLGFSIGITTGAYPKEFRHDVSAGCQAAPG
jgi:hypothetical protein